jgi:NagD protein
MSFKGILTDMDGVLVQEDDILPGAKEFIALLRKKSIPFRIVTNNPLRTPADLSNRLYSNGLKINSEEIYTSAIATATYIREHKKGAKVYALGTSGITTCLHSEGLILADEDVDFVCLSETRDFTYSQITRAIQLIDKGAKFICTNSDTHGVSKKGLVPSTGAIANFITSVIKTQPYVVGKPNGAFLLSAIDSLNVHRSESIMIGDSLETDILASVNSGIKSILVKTGVTTDDLLKRSPYLPDYTLDSINDVLEFVNKYF